MNQRSKSLLIDCGIALILTILIGSMMKLVIEQLGMYIGLTMLPVLWLSLRYGYELGSVVALIASIILGILSYGFSDIMLMVLYYIIPITLSAGGGLFARNTHKTLNNRRYSSTYLNISTASLLASLVYYLVLFWIGPLIAKQSSLLPINAMDFWISLIVTAAINALILCLMARFVPKTIIPKRSPYLSRKETSALLND